MMSIFSQTNPLYFCSYLNLRQLLFTFSSNIQAAPSLKSDENKEIAGLINSKPNKSTTCSVSMDTFDWGAEFSPSVPACSKTRNISLVSYFPILPPKLAAVSPLCLRIRLCLVLRRNNGIQFCHRDNRL